MMTKSKLQAADKVPNIDGNTFPGVNITPVTSGRAGAVKSHFPGGRGRFLAP